MAADLATTVALLEAEVALLEAEPRRWRRDLHPWEDAAAFAAIDTDVGVVARTVAQLLGEFRAEYARRLRTELRQLPTAEAVVRRAMELDANGPRSLYTGAARMLEGHEEELREVLREAANAGAESVVREAAARGVTLDLHDVAEQLREDVEVAAIRLANGPQADLLRAVREEAARQTMRASADDVAAALLQTVADLSDAPLDDYARTASSNLYGDGRVQQAVVSGEPARIYASELLDGNTCGPCSTVDGREYATLEQARDDYPDGYYRSCEGGVRCRGTLVFVWNEEPTGDTPPPPTAPPEPAPEPDPEPPAPATPARTFDYTSEAEEWGEATWDLEWSKDDMRAATFYQGQSYRSLNGMLRGTYDPYNVEVEKLRERVAQLDDVVARLPLPEDVVAYRGVGRGFVEALGANGDLTGLEFTDPAFMSTALASEQAASFAEGAMFRIRVPAGTPAVWLDAAAVSSLHETELLLGRGRTLRVVGIAADSSVPNRSGVPVYDVEVIG